MADTGESLIDKSKNYSKYRYTYPAEVLTILNEKYMFNSRMSIADMDCGKGNRARLFLENGNPVFCVDPNEEMLQMARENLKEFSNVTFLRGYAEKSGLEESSINLIITGETFYRFNFDRVKVEFKRILRGPNLVALMWNIREEDSATFNEEYERICKKYSPGYHGTSGDISEDLISDFFGWSHGYFQLDNTQDLDIEEILGRYASEPYSISAEDPKYNALVNEFKESFSAYEKNGKVRLKYTTKMFVGHLK